MRTILVRAMTVAVIAVALAGCGIYHWRKPGPGGGSDAFQRDSEDCQQQAAPGKWQDCMTGKGWIYDTRL